MRLATTVMQLWDAVIVLTGVLALLLWARHITVYTPETMAHALTATVIVVALTMLNSGVERLGGI